MKIFDLFEAPIEDLSLIGNWDKGASFKHAQDRKLLTNPKAQAKIIHKWENTKVPFNIYMVNVPGAGKYIQNGEVSREWIENNLPTVSDQIKINTNAINVIFTNNDGSPRAPMTAWIIAHRFGHSLNPSFTYGKDSERKVPEFTEIRDELFSHAGILLTQAYGFGSAYGGAELPSSEKKFNSRIARYGERAGYSYEFLQKLYKGFYTAIGTMRSANEKKISNEFEFTYELLAQYMLTGKIKFKSIPDKFRYGSSVAFLRYKKDKEYFNNTLEDLGTNVLPSIFDRLLDKCVGRIFVM